METTLNTILDGSVSLLQPASGYRAAIDPVFLAAYTDAKDGETVLDAGCGVGTAGFCLLHRVPGCAVTGIDIAPELVELARENATTNEAADRARFMQADIRDTTCLDGQTFDRVMMNPPFLENDSHTPSPDTIKAAANGEQQGTLDDWIVFARAALKPGGALSLIHRADRVDAVLTVLAAHKFGCLRLCPLWPKTGKAAKRILISARKDKRGPAEILPGMVLHNADGGYTDAATDVLYKGNALFIE